MKSKSSTLMKLNPSLYPPKAISSQSDFICEADLFRRKTDLTEKTACFDKPFFLVEMRRVELLSEKSSDSSAPGAVCD